MSCKQSVLHTQHKNKIHGQEKMSTHNTNMRSWCQRERMTIIYYHQGQKASAVWVSKSQPCASQTFGLRDVANQKRADLKKVEWKTERERTKELHQGHYKVNRVNCEPCKATLAEP